MDQFRRFLFALTCTIVAVLARHSIAALGDVDPGFNPAVNGRITLFVPQPDGKILITGGFTEVDGVPRNGFARLNSDGTLDPGFEPQTPTAFPPLCLAVQADGRIVVGMRFGYLRRLHPDGTSDPSFTAGVLEDIDEQIRESDDYTAIHGILVQPDERILVWGVFTKVNGLPRTHLARLHTDGSLDAGFSPVLTGDEYLHVSMVGLDPDGRVFALGDIGSVNGQPANNFFRVNGDGTFDAPFQHALNTIHWGDNGLDVEDFVVQPDGKLLIAGDFDGTAHGINFSDLVRLNENGSLDPEFVADVPSDPEPIVLQADGKVLIAIGRSLLRLNGNGSFDANFSTVVAGSDQDTGIYRVAIQPDGKVLIGGIFTGVNGARRNGFARLLGQPGNEVTVGPLRFVAGQPGFDISCVSPRTVVIEASTNLIHWNAIQSLPVGSSPVRFNDPDHSQLPSKLYRVSWQP